MSGVSTTAPPLSGIGDGVNGGLVALAVIFGLGTMVATFKVWDYYAKSGIPFVYKFTTISSWFLAYSIVYIIPIDVHFSVLHPDENDKDFPYFVIELWLIFYWVSFLLAYLVIELEKLYYRSGYLETGLKFRDVLNQILFQIGAFIVALIIVAIVLAARGEIRNTDPYITILSFLGNLFGVIYFILLLGYGVVEVPRHIWKVMDRDLSLKRLYRKAVIFQNDMDDALESMAKEAEKIKLVKVKLGINELNAPLKKTLQLQKYITTIESTFPEDLKKMRVEVPESFVKQIEKKEITVHTLAAIYANVKAQDYEYKRTREQFQVLYDRVMKVTDGKITDYTAEIQQTDPAQVLTRNEKILQHFLRGVSVICVILSAMVLISELLFYVPVKGGGSASLLALIIQEAKTNLPLTQFLSLMFVLYIVACVVYGLFRLRLGKFYHLHRKATDVLSLLDNAGNILKTNSSLAQNYLLLIGFKYSGFSRAFPKQNLQGFQRFIEIFVPIVLAIFAFATAFNLYGRLLKFVRISQYVDGDGDSGKEAIIKEGKLALAQEARRRRKEMHKLEKKFSPGRGETIDDFRKPKLEESGKFNASAIFNSSADIKQRLADSPTKEKSSFSFFSKPKIVFFDKSKEKPSDSTMEKSSKKMESFRGKLPESSTTGSTPKYGSSFKGTLPSEKYESSTKFKSTLQPIKHHDSVDAEGDSLYVAMSGSKGIELSSTADKGRTKISESQSSSAADHSYTGKKTLKDRLLGK